MGTPRGRSTMPLDDLRLAMFVGPGAEIIVLADYLTLRPQARDDLTVSPTYSCISLLAGGEERWGPLLSFGALGLLSAQFPQAAERIRNHQRAVIRGAGFDSPVAEYVFFDQAPDGMLVATTAATDDPTPQLWLPHQPEASELYTYVAKHHRNMLSMGQEIRGLAAATVTASSIADALDRETGLAAKVAKLLGPGSW